jgi:hypothetical protein
LNDLEKIFDALVIDNLTAIRFDKIGPAYSDEKYQVDCLVQNQFWIRGTGPTINAAISDVWKKLNEKNQH